MSFSGYATLDDILGYEEDPSYSSYYSAGRPFPQNLEQTVVNQIADTMAHAPASLHEELEGFRNRNIEQWTSEDCFDWALATCRDGNLRHDDCRIYVFKLLTGRELLTYTIEDFSEYLDSIHGPFFYEKFQEIVETNSTGASGQVYTNLEPMEQWNDSNDHTEFQSSSYGATSCSYSNDDSSSSLFNGGYNDYRSPNVLDASFETKYEDFTMHDPTDESSRYSQTASPFNCASTVPISELEFGDLSLEGSTNLGATSPYLDESSTSSFDKEVVPRQKKSRTRSSEVSDDVLNSTHWFTKIPTGGPRKHRFRSPKSWEFVLRLLQDPSTNPSLVRWDDEGQGVFRLMQKEVISRMWGNRNNVGGDNLAYESFARLLRHHYKSKILLQVREKQMVYQFGPKVIQKLRQGYRW